MIRYDAQYRVVGDPDWIYVEDIGPEPWVLSGLGLGTEYETQIRAHDTSTGLSSDWSDLVIATTAAPPAEYWIFRRTPPTGVDFDPDIDIPVSTVSHPTTSYNDTQLPAAEYEWQVFSYDGTKFSSGSILVSAEVTEAGGTLFVRSGILRVKSGALRTKAGLV